MMQVPLSRVASAVLLLLTGSITVTAATGASVWPVPSHYSSGDKVLWIAEDVVFTYEIVNNLVIFPLFTAFQHWVVMQLP